MIKESKNNHNAEPRNTSLSLNNQTKSKNKLRNKLECIMPEIFEKIIIRNTNQGKISKSRFDCSAKVKLSIKKYIIRLIKYTEAEDETLVHALALIDKICLKEIYLSERNIYKLFLVSLIVSLKILEDEVYTDKHYASAGGISVKEYSEIEADFLALLDYKVQIDSKTLKIYFNSF